MILFALPQDVLLFEIIKNIHISYFIQLCNQVSVYRYSCRTGVGDAERVGTIPENCLSAASHTHAARHWSAQHVT